MFKSFGIGALVLLLAACAAIKARHAEPQNPAATVPGPQLPAPGRAFTIDQNRSELRVLVFRAGPLARFGHNHVIVNRAVRGAVNLGEHGPSTFWLEVPAALFVVDDAGARREEGAEFAGDIPDDAKTGTLHNMLSAAVLDAEAFPVITVKGITDAAAPGAAHPVARISVSVAGHESTIDAPFVLDGDSHLLSASGSVELRQSALGLTPYSLMLGALQVQDAMTIKFRLVAVE